MKIGIDARMIKATGIGRYVSNLILNLAKIDKKNEYVVFLKKEDFDDFYPPVGGLPFKNIKKELANFHWYTLSEQIEFPKVLKSANLDLMHFPHFNVPYAYSKPFIITIHDLTLHRHKTIRASTKNLLTYNLKHWLYKKIIKRSAKKALKIFTPSEFTKTEIIKILKIRPEKIIVTKEGGASDELLKTKADKNVFKKFKIEKPYLLYVGNSYPHKNLSRLVEILKLLKKDINLVLAGKTDEFYQRLREEIVRENFKKQVVITGYVTDPELVALYKNASVYVFPSLNEGFGLPPLEAMAFGVPVVSSNTSCLTEILGEAALYFDPLDTKDMAKKIKTALDNKELRQKLIVLGHKQIKKYSFKKMAKETLDVYNEIDVKFQSSNVK